MVSWYKRRVSNVYLANRHLDPVVVRLEDREDPRATAAVSHTLSTRLSGISRVSSLIDSREHSQNLNMSVNDFLGKKYKLDTSDKFDDFMHALGVGLMTRTMAVRVSPTVELTENAGLYTLKTSSTFKNTDIKFKLGEEFEEETPDGRKVKSVITIDGNKMLHVQKGEKETVIEREFTPTEMKAVMKVDNVVCTRTYKLVE